MRRWLLSPKRRVLVVLAVGAGLNVLIRSVSSSRIADVLGYLIGIGCLLAVARFIRPGPLRKRRRPVSQQVEPVRHVSSPDRENPVDQLVRLAGRRESGELGQDEFDAQKRRILDLEPGDERRVR